MAKVLKKKKILFSFLPQWASLLLQLRHDYNLLFIRCGSVASVVSDTAAPWTAAHQAPLSMGFSRQEYWSGLPCPPPGGLPDPGIQPASPASLASQTDSLPLSHQGSPLNKVPDLKVNLEN